jgi:hypothetical protein
MYRYNDLKLKEAQINRLLDSLPILDYIRICILDLAGLLD